MSTPELKELLERKFSEAKREANHAAAMHSMGKYGHATGRASAFSELLAIYFPDALLNQEAMKEKTDEGR